MTTSTSTGPVRRPQGQFFGEYSVRRRVLLSQLPLTISAALATLAVLLSSPQLATVSPHLLGGLGGILALTVAAGVTPWERLPAMAFWAIPLLDFVAIAPFWSAARFALDGMSLLTAFPVFWLAWTGVRPWLGISLGVLGSGVVAWWPYLPRASLFTEEAVIAQLYRPALVPLMMLSLGVAASVLTRSLDRQSSELAASLRDTAIQNRLLNAVVETSEVGILVVDRDGHDLVMNHAQRRQHFLGLPAGVELAGEADLLIFEPDGVTPLDVEDRPVRRALQGEAFQGRIVAVGTDGSQQHLSVSASPMVDEEGAFDGTVVVFQNVTDLVGALRARDQFVAEVSHEFRTPLTSIIGYLDLALDAPLDPEVERHLTTSIRNAERLLTLVSNLLDARADPSALTVQEVDLPRLVRHSLDSAAVRAERAGITVEAQLPDHLTVIADAVRVSQVLDNLVSNALKYTSSGGTVTVALRQLPPGGAAGAAELGPEADNGWAELVVRDTGIGMTEHERSQLFTSFFRAEHVRKAAIPGTGLGLAISQGFIRAHGGEIRVASRRGEGSTFTLRLPLQGPPAADAGDDAEAVEVQGR